MNRKKTESIFQELCELIPGGVNSPVRACRAVEELPLVASHASGDMIIDVDGKHYIDFCMSWGPLIHGHAHPQIVEAIQEALLKGTTFGTTSLLELKLAKKVTSLIPSIEKVRFVSSGTEATMSAIRLARGFTKKDLIIKFIGHYHGHADYFLVKTGSGAFHLNDASSAGIPKELVQHTICLPFNDLEAFKKVMSDPMLKNRIAAVILEPIAGNMGVVPATKEFIKELVHLTKENDTLLIFDEVMTGFRVAKGGAAEVYNVTPDLICLGKIVGGGMPAAAFGGRREIMDHLAPLGSVYQAGTLSGNPLAMAAGFKTLEMLDHPGFYKELESKTKRFLSPIEEFIKANNINACIQSIGSMFTLFFGKRKVSSMEDAKELDFKKFGRFFRFMLKEGVYFPPLQQEACFLSMAHTEEHLLRVQSTILEFLQREMEA